MKILHVQAQLPTKTGSGVYFSNVMKGLAPHHEQACVYGCYEGYEYDVIPQERQYPLVFPNDICAFSLPGMSDVMPYKSTIYGEMTEEMIENWQKAFREVIINAYNDFQPDVILCHHLWFITSMVRELFPKDRVLAFCHGTDIRQADQHPHLLEKYVKNIHELEGIFSLSKLQVTEIQEIYKVSENKIQVVGGGFDEKVFYPTIREEEKREVQVIFAGKIAQAKGVFQLIEAFEKILAVKSNVTLSIIGAANEEAKKIMAPYLANNKKIRIYNVANQKLLAEEFRQGDIFVLPSYYEGLGLVAIESLACGMRVVVTEIPALQAQLGEEINQSGVIEYVPLPRLENEDEPFEEDLEKFRINLAEALLKQIEGIERNEKIDADIHQQIMKSSWRNLITIIENEL